MVHSLFQMSINKKKIIHLSLKRKTVLKKTKEIRKIVNVLLIVKLIFERPSHTTKTKIRLLKHIGYQVDTEIMAMINHFVIMIQIKIKVLKNQNHPRADQITPPNLDIVTR